MKLSGGYIFGALIIVSLCFVEAQAQWVEESVTLSPGWNAVYFHIRPEPSDLDQIFAAYPEIVGIWRWNMRFSPVDFDMDPSDPLRDEEVWLRWYPDGHPYRSLRNMYDLQGNVGHLVQVDTNAGPFTLSVTGCPLPPEADWFEYQLNLMGLPIDQDNPPSFSEYFAPVSEIGVLPRVDDGEIYEIDSDADGNQVLQPARVFPERNQAYWILCGDKTDYAGPLRVTAAAETSGMLDFGTAGVEGSIVLENVLTNEVVDVQISRISSASPPAGQPAIAGIPPLGYYDSQGTNGAAWTAWTGSLTRSLTAGESWNLRICVWRSALMTNAPGMYQCLLEIKESSGRVRCCVPVRAEVEAEE